MHYRYVIVDICDEFYLALQKDLETSSKYRIQPLDEDSGMHCEISGKDKQFTKRILTDYSVPFSPQGVEARKAELEEKVRTLEEGFELLAINDFLEKHPQDIDEWNHLETPEE